MGYAPCVLGTSSAPLVRLAVRGVVPGSFSRTGCTNVQKHQKSLRCNAHGDNRSELGSSAASSVPGQEDDQKTLEGSDVLIGDSSWVGGSRGEAEFLAALQEAQEISRQKLPVEGSSSSRPQYLPLRGRATGPSRETLARLEKARQYREMADKRYAGIAPEAGASAETMADPAQTDGEHPEELQQSPLLDPRLGNENPASSAPSSAQRDTGEHNGVEEVKATASEGGTADTKMAPRQRADTGRGSASMPANFLANVVQQGIRMEEGMSMEQFTLKKEAEMKARGAEIITIDGKASASSTEVEYRPKVATWGVFPRPQNISEAFGGGRNIRPGQELESEADRKARDERVKAAMSAYRKQMGLDIDPEVERSCRAAYDLGIKLLSDGRLKEAVVNFEITINGMSVRTQLGGEARLQKAICLDSMGRAEEAYALYRQVRMHPSSTVAKKAKRMLFGFEAAENLKAHTISYGPSKGEYEHYFRRIGSDWNSAYTAPEGEAETDYTLTTVVATAVMLSPIILVGAKVGSSLLKQ